jgi:two-component system, sensor histidine kinase and response regulator
MNMLRFKKLLVSEPPARNVLDCLTDVAIQFSADWKQVEHLNLRGLELVGWPPNNFSGLTRWKESLLDSSSHAEFEQLISRMVSNQPPGEQLTVSLKSIVGSSIPIRIHTVFLCSTHWIVLGSCVADESTADDILRQTQARFRSIVDGLSVNLLLKDRQGHIIYANQRFLEHNRWQLSDILGKTDLDLFPPDLARKFLDDDRAVIETGQVLHQLEEATNSDGSHYWAEVIKGPLLDADDRIAGVQVLFWDATDRKTTEQALQFERHLLHTLLDNVPDSIYFKDKESRFVRISRSMLEKFGLGDLESVIGKTDADIFTVEHANKARIDELEIMRTEQPMIAIVEKETWPNRDDTWSSTTKLPLRDPNGQIVGTFGISRDVTELVNAQRELSEARDVANQANQAKSEFLANMSHEIRTPMNGIIGMTELLTHTRLTDAQRSFVTMIEQSAQSLLRIVNDILDFSKIEAGKLDLEAAPFDLRGCVSMATKSLATRAAQQGTELLLRISREIPEELIGDEIRLRQVLVNLIGNAVKFTQGGEITVRVSVADGPPAAQNYNLHFSVADTGIGIPLDKQAKIFEAFSQADVSTTRQYGGTGLGLSIASQLVQMMGGRIWLESELGTGSTFHFTGQFAPTTLSSLRAEPVDNLQHMPVLIVDDNAHGRQLLAQTLSRRGMMARETDSGDEALRILDLYLRETPGPIVMLIDQIMPQVNGLELISKLQQRADSRKVITILLTTASHPVTEQQMERFRIDGLLQKPALASEICHCISQILGLIPAQAEAKAKEVVPVSNVSLRLLLAEDGAVNRAVFLGLLTQFGHEVTCVEDGEAAVEAWQEFDFDAIFMDVQMPVLDGLEATQRIRQLESDGQHIPIIAITAGAMADDQQRCLQAGMDDYLSKPIDTKQLRSVLESLALHIEGRTTQWQDAFELPETSLIESKTVEPSSMLNFDAPLSKVRCTPQQQRTLVETLKNEANQRLDELAQAIQSQDDKLLVRASHSLRSAAALFEAKQVVEVSGAIENAARLGDTQTAKEHYGQLRKVTSEMLLEIDRWLASAED